eukprot:scaffold36427_cov64-Cyclotella_meneghiniana.AAC.2
MAPTKKKQKTKQVSLQQSMLKTSDHADSRASLNKLYLQEQADPPQGQGAVQGREDSRGGRKAPLPVPCSRNTNKFKSYPVTSPGEDLLDEYRMCLFEEDHELYNVYLGRKKKEENDRKDEEMRRRTEAAAADGSFKDHERLQRSAVKDSLELLVMFLSLAVLDWVCKKGAWKKENTVNALKCFNLERILTASQFNLETPEEVGMEKSGQVKVSQVYAEFQMARSRSRPQVFSNTDKEDVQYCTLASAVLGSGDNLPTVKADTLEWTKTVAVVSLTEHGFMNKSKLKLALPKQAKLT